jgi:glycosyltransferase involved in cell wall biosynthesis
MKISVILSTYNRCQSLAKALSSVAASVLPEGHDWEVIVVDNNSTDQTREVVEEFQRRHRGRFRYVFESKQGLSHARNAGIREARGDILAFMDDDVTVETTWLENLTAPLRNGEWAGSGGRIMPEQTFVPPRWLSLEGRYALAPLAIFDYGPIACELTESPFGTNMAFQRKMFEKYGGFRTDLGRCGGNMMSNEDTEFGSRLLVAGERLSYEPSALVFHSIPLNRVRKEYFLAWWLGKARGEIREYGIQPGTKWFAAGVPLYLFRRLVVWTIRWMISVPSDRRFSCKLKVWGLVGSILESHGRSRDTTRQGLESV